MTQSAPPRPPADRQLARDVARHIDRRRVRRRVTVWSALLALVAAAAAYLRCGGSFGLFGLGTGGDGGGGSAIERAAPPRAPRAPCEIRLSANGITVGGDAMARDAAIDACKASGKAALVVTGDARHGDREELVGALRAAGIHVTVQEPSSPGRAPPEVPGGAPAEAPRR